MIRIRIEFGSHGFCFLEASGHARLAAPGNDILCAAVSVLVENLGLGLTEILDAPALIEEDKGHYSIRLAEEVINDRTELLFTSAILGLKRLEEQYPDRLEITDKNP